MSPTPGHPAAAGEQEPRGRRKLSADIWALVAAAFIVALGYGLIAPVLPQFAASFDLGVTAATIVVSSFAFCRFVFAPAGGRLVDRFGEPRIYVTGLLVVAASTAAVAGAQTYWQLLVFRGLGGLGSTMFTVSAMALIVRLAPPDSRARATSLYASAFLVGNIAGPVVGGAMAGWGMRVPFVVYAVALVLAALVVHVRLVRALPAAPAEAAADSSADADPGAGPGEDPSMAPGPECAGPTDASAPVDPPAAPTEVLGFREALRDSAYRAALFSAFVNGWASMGIRVAIYPLFAVAVLGSGAAEAGIALTVFALGNVVAVTVVGRYADVHGRKPFIVTGLIVTGAATLVLGLSPNVWVFWALSLVAGLGAGLLNPAQQAVVSDVVAGHRGGRVLSRYQMAQDLGAIVGPIGAGVLIDHTGYGSAFALTGAAALAAAVAWIPARETLPGRATREERTAG